MDRIVIALAAGWLLLGATAGCPPREAIIDISPTGAGVVVNACSVDELELELGELCDGIIAACEDINDDRCGPAIDLCVTITEDLAASTCTVLGLPRAPQVTQGRLKVSMVLTLASSDLELRVATPCTKVAFVCANGFDTACIADGMNAAIATAAPEGLGFDGLDDPADAIPIVLLYTDDDDDGAIGCVPEELFACAALGERRPGEETYDVLCGSCQGGQKAPFEAAPCGSCFLPECAALSKLL